MSRTRLPAAVVAVVAVVATSLVALGCSSLPTIGGIGQPGAEAPAAAGSSVPDTELVPVTRQDVIETEKAEATVGHGSRVTLPIQAEGIVTWVPAPDAVVGSGDVIVEVAGRPVVLVVGESPLYRPLRQVAAWERDEAGGRLGPQVGIDVAQLQQFLLDNGFDDAGRLIVDEMFGPSTERAVKTWQASVGHPATGVVDTSQMIFMTRELLLDTRLVVGEAFRPLEATGTDTILQVIGSTSLREFFPVGGWVEVRPDDPLLGVVTRSSRVATGESNDVRQLIEITVAGVTPDELGQSVRVVGNIVRATDAITVPVRALLATSDGRWQVETGSGATVDVELTEVVDTTAIVTGLDEGTEVVVPL